MTQKEIFGGAKWICAKTGARVPLIRKNFSYSKASGSASLRIIGLGTFVCFINGERVGDEYFMPLMSKFENTFVPEGEELSGFHAYVSEYDITRYLREGENTLSVMLGESDYTELRYDGIHRILGEKKVIFRIMAGDSETVSDGSEKFIPSFILRSGFHEGGEHDYRGHTGDEMLPEYDDSKLESVFLSQDLLDTEYSFSSCPPDKIIRSLPVRLVYTGDNYKIYDCGENTTGYPVVTSRKGYVGEVRITFSEELSADRTDIDISHSHAQHLYAAVDGKETEIYPRFSWFGFRYFRVEGEALVREVKVIHAKIDVTSSFETNDPVLNWIYGAYVNTQLANMHRGCPLDCPHLERNAYTGDGQLIARSAMMALGAREFYKKWITDISDSQDKITGRVQYTAPYYISCGGGPGGWSSAIVSVPYEYYLAYGDVTYIKRLYPAMLKYLDFLESRSEGDLVVSFKEGDWCLGDWAWSEKQKLPEPFVNTYFRILSTMRVIKIARIIGREEDIPRLTADIEKCKAAINGSYLDSDGVSYCGGILGANAFALNIGLGTEKTEKALVEYYSALGYLDTGIFGTELVIRELFRLGAADVAYKLLVASEPYGYGRWYKIGSTTLREYFGEPSRSHSHPMFGSVVSSMYEYILGIGQDVDSAGYERIRISPVNVDGLDFLSGHITTPRGKISVSYRTESGKRFYTVEIPKGSHAEILIHGTEPRKVTGGIYKYEVKLQ